MDVQALRDRRAQAIAELQDISGRAQQQRRGFTNAERARIATLQREDDRLASQIAEVEIDGRVTAAAMPGKRRSDPDMLGVTPRSSITSTLASDGDPRRGFRHPREFLLSVMDASMGSTDPRLRPLFVNAQGVQTLTVGSDEARGISDPAGGFLVPEAFSPDFLTIAAESDPIAPLTMKVSMPSPRVRIPARVDKNHTSSVSGGLTVTRRPETVSATASQMTFEQVVLEAVGLFGLSYASEEILMDSRQAFVQLLTSSFKDQFGGHLTNERLNGTGVGEFLGVMNALDASSTGPTISISKETGQAANTVVYENIIKMRARCWGYNQAVWLANHDCLPQLMLLNQSVGVGGIPVWQPSAREDHPDTLLGRPLVFSEFCQTCGTTGDIVLGNWTQYLEGTYEPLQNAESMHVRFVNHERAFKFWTRNAAAPWWKSALTPKTGSNKLSPFVILATRS